MKTQDLDIADSYLFLIYPLFLFLKDYAYHRSSGIPNTHRLSNDSRHRLSNRHKSNLGSQNPSHGPPPPPLSQPPYITTDKAVSIPSIPLRLSLSIRLCNPYHPRRRSSDILLWSPPKFNRRLSCRRTIPCARVPQTRPYPAGLAEET